MEQKILSQEKINDQLTLSTLIYSFGKTKNGSELFWKKMSNQFNDEI